jgi:hypothetical protein
VWVRELRYHRDVAPHVSSLGGAEPHRSLLPQQYRWSLI